MEKEFLKYEEALALKELGFNEKCYGYYTKYKEYFYFDVDDMSSHYTKNLDNLIVNSVDPLQCTAPLYQQVFRWFREKHYKPVISSITLDINKEYKDWHFNIYRKGEHLYNLDHRNGFDTYEEAQLACLKKLIEILKEKK